MAAKYMLGNQDVDTSFLTLEMTWHGMQDKRIKKQIGHAHPVGFAEIIKGKTINYYVEAEKTSSFVKICAKKLLENKELLEFFKLNTIKTATDIRNVAKKNIEKLNSSKDEQLANLLLNIKKTQAECMIYGTAVAWCDIHGDITNSVLKILNKRSDLKYPLNIYTKVLATPNEKSITETAYIDICNTKESDEYLLHEYFWLEQGYIGRGLNKKQLEEIRKAHSNKEEILPPEKELLEELKLIKEEKRIFQVSKDIIKIKSLRDDSRQFLNVVVNRIVDMLSKKWKIKSQYLESMYAEEIADVLTVNKKLPNNLEKRWEHSVITSNGITYGILVGNKAKEFLKKHVVKERIEEKEEVKGQTAQPGKTSGIARLIFGPQHNNKIQERDILISPATSPQLLPAMKKAAAFVTDIGGITSHAAIVARELQKPCVVGTKHATQIFKDGDLIEVDANKGVVKIIKRSK